MHSLWNPEKAAQCASELARRVYSSQLLGADDTLVLHGGGNTSLKQREKNLVAEEEEILYVKGSGWDLATIKEPGFAPVRIAHLLKLARLDQLSDPEMVNELATQVTRAGAPAPSVEAILHAILPHRYVDHTHADAVLAVTNTKDGAARIREIYGDEVVIIPYVMPGFDLARLCAQRLEAEAHRRTIGMVLLNHGIFSFGDTAEESYERMIALVGRAEAYLDRNHAWSLAPTVAEPHSGAQRHALAKLRAEIAKCAGFPVLLASLQDPKSLAFAQHGQVATLSQQGPATPDHVIRTKRVPMLGRDVAGYARAYAEYFTRNAALTKDQKTMLDAAPRVVLDSEFGLCTVGRSAKDARIVQDVYSHTIDVILRATALGGYRALPEKDLFDVEYWDLEQAKLKRAGSTPPFGGEVALVTGAASGIGKACVDSLLKRGAAVIGLDLKPEIAKLYDRPDFLGIPCDVTSQDAVLVALEAGVKAFGGLDILVLNAGIFPEAKRVDALDADAWRSVMDINLDSNLLLLRECHPLLALAPQGGRVVVIGSKNVPAPGPGAAAYSASKAALTQLARVAALEWGKERIRVNVLHPNAVFDTGLWTEEVLASRAKSYGLSIDEYKTNNVLKIEVKSRDVAELAAELCGALFEKTTGLQIPIDGGNERVI
ncbi:MAG TPA: bifunctional aldolase/short-chain dehydrogenase [Polyangiaceae bacterium]|jgi:rhamnose utilization protein RhaD (predicted bifunctional aldolase and dehydrogenase)/NAD(P)-dependent dehydrogenase (short-subunit alcohol dehydrogenase family)|nr:bifunctional aldolase/short-chain dehydrogenase [Polyangiaceae bacterium]